MITKTEARDIINDILLLGLEDIESNRLIQLLELADDLYYNDEVPILQDSDYDTYFRYVKNSDPTNPYFLGVGSSVRGGKVKLPFQMGSLDQIHEGNVVNWIVSNALQDQIAVLSDKLDGASGMIIYDNSGSFQIAYSRGNGVEGADISRHISQLSSVPATISSSALTIRGEIIISKRNFPFAKKQKTRNGVEYKNARNMVSGLMNASENPQGVYQYVDFVAYEIVGSELGKEEQLLLLNQLGFLVVKYELVEFNKLNDIYLTAHLDKARLDSEYDIDGTVVDVNSATKRSDMNPSRTTLNPAYSIKYKVADASNLAEAVVVDVEINISKHGYLKPRVQIEPIELVGVTVTWATGFNMKFISDNKIGPGAKVKITRSGDVIPFLVDTSLPYPGDYTSWFNKKIESIGKCHWTDTGIDLVLDDAAINSTARFQLLVDFFDSIDAPHLGEGNLQKMFELGFETPESIIELTQEDISSLVNSQQIGKKIFTGLQDKLTNIPLYKLMGAHPAFGRGVGIRKMKKLYDAFAGDMGACLSTDAIIIVDGFEIKTANKIKHGYPIFLDFLENVGQYITIAPYEAPRTGSLSGQSIVFTGFRDSQLEQLVVNKGGKISTSVSGKTNLVVALDPNSNSGKVAKARELDKVVISADELREMLEQ